MFLLHVDTQLQLFHYYIDKNEIKRKEKNLLFYSYLENPDINR